MKVIFQLMCFCLTIMLAFTVLSAFADDKPPLENKRVLSDIKNQTDYKIGRGDILEIITWKEPDLSRKEVIVRTDGKISFPLVNDIQAAGLSTEELKKVVEARLKKYIENPIVNVNVTDLYSQKFYILGEVKKIGEYPLTKNLTVLQAFALAGGFTEWAAKTEIILLRKENGQDQIYRINYKNIVKGKKFDLNLPLQADDTIIVP